MRAETVKKAASYAEAGYTVIRVAGKVPAAGWNKAEYIWPEDIEAFLSTDGGQKFYDKNKKQIPWDGNFGVVLTRTDLVIDIDPRNFKGDDKPHVRLFKDIGVDVKELGAIVRTGGGGVHVYLRLPAGDRKIRETLPDYPGIEFKSRGRQVVGMGSIHPGTKKPYEYVGGRALREILEAPQSLLDLICAPSESSASEPDRPAVIANDAPEVVQKYTEWLKDTAPIAVQGELGDKTTFAVACKGRDLGLTEPKTYELMLGHYNHRCVPEWPPRELRYKVHNAYSYASGKMGAELPESEFSPVVDPTRHPLFRGWDRYENGRLQKTLNNVFNYFLIANEPFRDTIGYDEFNAQVRILKKLPWHTEENRLPPAGAEWRDEDSVQLRLWLSREKQFDVPLPTIDQSVLVAAQLKILHPVKDYLRALRWDGTRRLQDWLITYAGAADTPFVREVSKKFLLQAVSRVYHPGCKADYIIVLEGAQGVGKSSVVEILGGPWYGDIIIDPHARDTVDAMRGKWFIEFSEMEAASRHDAQAMKAFITRKIDRVRLAYGRRSVDLPRQCVFIGTMNPDATGEYFNDSTGNRRWWPITIKRVDFEGLAAVRDQLFAEAADLVLKGEAIHIIDREILGLAITEQRKRQSTDPWAAAIAEYVGKEKIDFLTTKDIWVYVLKGAEAALNLGHQRRIASCLQELGYVKHVRRNMGHLVRGYVLETVLAEGGDIFA